MGQHTGMGTPSAKTGVAPDASSKNVTKIILTIVFFICFFSYGEFSGSWKVPELYCAEQGLGQHIGNGTVSAEAKVGA